MKWRPFVLAAVMALLLPAGASGEYYQYTDQNGVVRFTDDPSIIPEDQRPEVKTYESIKSEYHPQQEMTEEKSAPEAARNTATVEEADTAKTSNSANREKEEEMNALRIELLKAFDALEAEKKALGPPPLKNAKTIERKEYNNKVTELNRKIDDYDKRRKELDEKVKAYTGQKGNK